MSSQRDSIAPELAAGARAAQGHTGMSARQPAPLPVDDDLAEIFQAGLRAAAKLPPITAETARRIAAILAPILREEMRAQDEGQDVAET